jgi:hypothetical protein
MGAAAAVEKFNEIKVAVTRNVFNLMKIVLLQILGILSYLSMCWLKN